MGCCRSLPGTRGCWRSRASWPRRCPPEVGRLTSFPVEEGAVEAIAERLNGWLALPEARAAEAREALVETARRLWSWEGVARGVIAASRGDLDRLPLA